jgi:hypothetical protein
VISPAGGTFAAPTTATITDSNATAVICYTTDGTTPTTLSAVYAVPIMVNASGTIQAVALAPGDTLSAVASTSFTIQSPAVAYATGFTTQGLALNGGAAVVGTALQLTDGGFNEARSVYFTIPMNVQAFSTTFDFQLVNAMAPGITFVIQNQGLTSIGSSGGGLGYGLQPNGMGTAITNSVAVKFDISNDSGEGTDSVGLYLNGASPTLPAVDLTSTNLQLNSGDVIHAQLTYDGTNLTLTLSDATSNTTATTTFPVDIPSVVGANTAYVGFTGATSIAAGATQNVLDWTYSVTP